MTRIFFSPFMIFINKPVPDIIVEYFINIIRLNDSLNALRLCISLNLFLGFETNFALNFYKFMLPSSKTKGDNY